MNLPVALFTYIQTKALLTAILSKRVFPSVAPQKAAQPFCVYTVTGEQRQNRMDGQTTLVHYFVSFRVFCASGASRESLVDAFKNVFSGRLNENITDGTITSLFECWFLNRQDVHIPADDGRDLGVFEAILDYKFTLNDSLPTLP